MTYARVDQALESRIFRSDAEKSKPNEQKQREKLELNERLPAELVKTFAVKTTIV